MKRSLLIFLTACGLVAPSFGASFDSKGFGAKLNGWRDDGTAVYDHSGASYTTHKPTVTDGPSGSMFLSTRVDLLAHADKGAVCQLSLNFSSKGVLQSIQIKGRIHGKPIDTRVVRRSDYLPEPVAADAEQGEKKKAVKPTHPTEEMVVELFKRFDLEFKRLSENQPPLRRDLFSRLSSQQVETADLSGGLRHNVNLLLVHVRAR